MGELERNMRDDVGQPQGNAPSTDNGGQMDMFEDECERASLHRRGAIARGVAKRCLVAFLAFAMAFGTTPAQLWAEGAEGIAEAVAQATTPSEGTVAADGAADQGNAEASDSGSAPAASAATTGAAAGDEGSATGENPAASEQSSTVSAGHAGSAAAAARPDGEPDRNRRCRQEASRGLVLDYRHRCRRQGSDLGGAYAAQARPRARRLRMPLLSAGEDGLQGGLRSEHGIRVLPQKHHIPERWPHACLRSDDLCLLAAVRRRRVFLGWREQRQAHPGAED